MVPEILGLDGRDTANSLVAASKRRKPSSCFVGDAGAAEQAGVRRLGV